jgi:hypothetical protein
MFQPAKRSTSSKKNSHVRRENEEQTLNFSPGCSTRREEKAPSSSPLRAKSQCFFSPSLSSPTPAPLHLPQSQINHAPPAVAVVDAVPAPARSCRARPPPCPPSRPLGHRRGTHSRHFRGCRPDARSPPRSSSSSLSPASLAPSRRSRRPPNPLPP